MRNKAFAWGRLLLRELIILLSALALGMGYSFLRAGAHLPPVNASIQTLLMLWQHGWRAALAIWIFLLIFIEVIRGIFRSPRLAVRLTLFEIAMAVLLLGSLALVRYLSFRDTVLEEAMLSGNALFLWLTLPVPAACSIVFLLLIWFTRRLLRPLEEIQRALEEFYTCGGGNQMALDGIPRTELYEVGRAFNQISLETKAQFNELEAISHSYARLVPGCLLELLGKRDVAALSAGDCATVSGALLVIAPKRLSQDVEHLNRLARITAEQVAAHGGMLTDYDVGLGSLTALLPAAAQAFECANGCLDDFDAAGQPVMAAILAEDVELGVFGGKRLLLPLAVSGSMNRKLAVLERLRGFGAVLVQSGEIKQNGLRLLGWDQEREFFEDPALRPPDWQAQWWDASGLWEQALTEFRERRYAQAMRKFAQVLRLMPDDMAARWYLFRCEALRDSTAQEADTWLLFDWRDRHG